MGANGEKNNKANANRQLAAYMIFILVAGCLLYCGAMKLFYKPKANDTPTNTQATTSTIHYEKVDLQTMLDDLETNALRAEETYQDMYVEITGEISNFDSDGKYISIIPCDAPLLSDRTMCYLTDPTHKAFLLEKAVGDMVTIKGKVVSIGEVIGYDVRIAEISD